jgi:hypothetical protein
MTEVISNETTQVLARFASHLRYEDGRRRRANIASISSITACALAGNQGEKLRR